MIKRHANRIPMHPGRLLREMVMPALDMTQQQVADELDISRQYFSGIIHERKPVSPQIAVKFGKFFGNGAGLWSRLQARYDIWKAEQSVDLSKIGHARQKEEHAIEAHA